jgi:hypothetical protein
MPDALIVDDDDDHSGHGDDQWEAAMPLPQTVNGGNGKSVARPSTARITGRGTVHSSSSSGVGGGGEMRPMTAGTTRPDGGGGGGGGVGGGVGGGGGGGAGGTRSRPFSASIVVSSASTTRLVCLLRNSVLPRTWFLGIGAARPTGPVIAIGTSVTSDQLLGSFLRAISPLHVRLMGHHSVGCFICHMALCSTMKPMVGVQQDVIGGFV